MPALSVIPAAAPTPAASASTGAVSPSTCAAPAGGVFGTLLRALGGHHGDARRGPHDDRDSILTGALAALPVAPGQPPRLPSSIPGADVADGLQSARQGADANPGQSAALASGLAADTAAQSRQQADAAALAASGPMTDGLRLEGAQPAASPVAAQLVAPAGAGFADVSAATSTSGADEPASAPSVPAAAAREADAASAAAAPPPMGTAAGQLPPAQAPAVAARATPVARLPNPPPILPPLLTLRPIFVLPPTGSGQPAGGAIAPPAGATSITGHDDGSDGPHGVRQSARDTNTMGSPFEAPSATAVAGPTSPAASGGAAGGGTNAGADSGGGGAASAAPSARAAAAGLLSTAVAPQALDTDALAGALTLSVRGGASEVTLRLHPAELGEVRVQLRVGAQGLTIRLEAGNDAAASALRDHAGELRDALATRGVVVADLHVLPGPSAPHTTAQQDAPSWQGNSRRSAQDRGDGRGGAPSDHGDPDADIEQ